MLKLATIVGARPQFIKAAALSRVLRSQQDMREVLVHTGQHYDDGMSEVFFRELDIPTPDHHLGVGPGSHAVQTARMLESLESVLLAERPDWVLVYGDTNSTLAGALAAAKLNLPVAHVEAGLRSFNRRMPEEINRVLTDHVSDLLFAPTEAAVANLAHEGVAAGRVHLVGDVMYDGYLFQLERCGGREALFESLSVRPGDYLLATVHRAENVDVPTRLHRLFDALALVARERAVVLPLHPRTRARLAQIDLPAAPGLRIIGPVGYLDMLALQKNACGILTDSGGVQKEAYFCRVPCLTLREETEWEELVELGWNRLVPEREWDALPTIVREWTRRVRPVEPNGEVYGGGRAAARIAAILKETIERRPGQLGRQDRTRPFPPPT